MSPLTNQSSQPSQAGSITAGPQQGKDQVHLLRDRVANAKPAICIERLRLITEAYEESRAAPPVIMRAKALHRILSGLPISIHEAEPLVGNITAKPPRGAPITPELNMQWVDDIDTIDTRPVDPLYISAEEKEIVKSYVPRWRGLTARDKVWALRTADIRRGNGRTFATSVGIDMGKGHTCVQYERVLDQGLEGVRREAKERLSRLDPCVAGDIDKIYFYQAVVICCDAVMDFARRYADLARAEAVKPSTSPERRRELDGIAAICDHVPAQPARTFHEALQSWWFLQIALFNEDPAYGFIPGRMDQILYRYYEEDLAAGRLTRDEALELVEHLYVKLNESLIILRTAVTRSFTGQPLCHNIVLGGLTRDGKDATNDLSHLFLEAEEEVRLVQPDLMVRVHEGTPDDFLLDACRVARSRTGKIKFLMDDVAIKSLTDTGATLEDSRDYVLVGCMEPFVPGKSNIILGASVNLAKCLEMALHNGTDPVSQEVLGLQTGPLEELRSFEDVVEAFQMQVNHTMRHAVRLRNMVLKINAEYLPVPLQSALTYDCLGKGLDLMDGGAEYSNHGILATGTVNVGDSLAAIKKLVFDEERVTLADIVEATRANYVGYESLLDMVEKAPKFGNDDDNVDLILKRVVDAFCEEVEKYRDHRGAQYIAALAVVTSNIPYGAVCGATPDGRLAGMPLSEGGISPSQGRNVNGATATMRSVCKLDLAKAKLGSVLNMRFSPGSLDTEEKLKKFASLLQAYRAMGGYLVQFNIVDSVTLRDAQQRPELHRDLTVRVATYSSLFTELSKELQDDIIARIEFEEV